MTQSIEFDGAVHEFPDSFSQDMISQALTSYKPPSVATDVGKQLLSSVPLAVEGIASAPAAIADLAGRGANYLMNKYTPSLVSPEAEQEQQNTKAIIEANRKGGIAQYLPEAQTTQGKYARAVPQFAIQAATAPGSLARNIVSGTIGGLTSETAGQLTEGTPLEPYARVGGAVVGGSAGLKAAESVAARSAAKAVPTGAAVENAATSTYKDLRSGHVQQPMTQPMLNIIADDVKQAVNKQGPRPSVAQSGHNAIEEIRTPATHGAPDVADLVSARQNFKAFFQNPMPDPNKAVAAIAIPRIEAAIEQLSPGTMKALKEADQNYSVAKATQALDKKMVRAELRAQGEHSGLNLGNKIRQKTADYLLSSESRYLPQAAKSELEKVVKGTTTQNLMRFGSNLLGGGGGLGSTLLGVAGATGGAYSGHPEAALLPFGGIGLRMLTNRSIANQAALANATLRGQSPLAKAAGIQGPRPRMSKAEMGLLASLFSMPATRGLLPFPEPTR